MIFLSFLSSFAASTTSSSQRFRRLDPLAKHAALHAFSAVVCFVQNAFAGSSTVEDPSADQGFFHGFSASTWLVISPRPSGGAGSFVLKCTNLTNRFATASSLVVTAIGAYNIFAPVTLPFGIGACPRVALRSTTFPPRSASKMDHELCGPVTAEPEKDEEADDARSRFVDLPTSSLVAENRCARNAAKRLLHSSRLDDTTAEFKKLKRNAIVRDSDVNLTKRLLHLESFALVTSRGRQTAKEPRCQALGCVDSATVAFKCNTATPP